MVIAKKDICHIQLCQGLIIQDLNYMNIRILTQIGLESHIFITVGDLFACGKTKP